METEPYLKAQRDKLADESQAALTLSAWASKPEAIPEWLGVAPGVANLAMKEGQEFSYGPSQFERPSDEYLDLILGQLAELGVTIRVTGPGAPALSGNVSSVGADLLRSVKAAKPHLVDRVSRTVTTWRRRKNYPVQPDPERPVAWDTIDEYGHCAGEDMPVEWMRWRYLYGTDRHTWHSATGWEWEEDRYDEPIFRKRYKPARVIREQAERDSKIPG